MHRFCLILLIASAYLYGGELLRYPAPSPDGREILFSARGNLWKVPVEGGRALQLTFHPAYDGYPIWSPDGSFIIFASDRYGNMDLFRMDADGRNLKRLTFVSQPDLPCDISPDGKTILFMSRRGFSWHWEYSLYEMPSQGGIPTLLFQDFGVFGSFSPDGTKVLYSPRSSRIYRKGYRGSGDFDLMLYDRITQSHTLLTPYDGDDLHGLWQPDGKGFYYLSDHDGVSNLWFFDLQNQKASQVTHWQEGDLYFPRIARNGSVIAYEVQGKGIYLYFPETGKERLLEVILPEDLSFTPMKTFHYRKDIQDYSLDGEEQQVAFATRGDIFIRRLLKKAATRPLVTTDGVEETPILTKDGSKLFYVSDKEGSQDIYLITSKDLKEPRLAYALVFQEEPLVAGPEDEHSPLLSPDEGALAYLEGNGKLWVMELKTRKKRMLAENWKINTFTWSPDGKWLAFSREDNDFNEDIYILPATGGTPVNVTRNPAYDTHPLFSPDGKYLLFASNRRGYEFDLYYLWLTREEAIKTEEQREDEWQRKKKEGKEEKTPPKITIDWEDIHWRVEALTELPGDETHPAITWAGYRIAFVAGKGKKKKLCIINRNKKEFQVLEEGEAFSHLKFTHDDKTLFYVNEKGELQSIDLTTKEKTPYPFEATVTHSILTLWKRVFLQGWRLLNRYFYDPLFHGKDWGKIKETYEPWIAQAYTRRDFDDLILQMVGELNASHLGIYPPQENTFPETGFLGLTFDLEGPPGGLTIAEILPKGPCDFPDGRIQPGDQLISINNHKVDGKTNYWQFLMGTVEKLTVLHLQRDGKTFPVGVYPVDFGKLRDLIYDKEERKMRQWVEQQSQGRVGYIHIRRMDMESLERFQMEVYSETQGKEGLIVDVRNNGGGWTTDQLLRILGQKPHAYTIPRGGGRGYPDFERKWVYTWKKPFVVLCNEYSFSNAEIFSHAVKTLNLATLVGVETNGSVISTEDIKLFDGSRFRIPFRGWYVYPTGENMEERGAIPDIEVVNPPEIWHKEGKDLQVLKALRVLLKQIQGD